MAADTAVAPKPEVVAPLMDTKFINECFGVTPEAATSPEASDTGAVVPSEGTKTTTVQPAFNLKRIPPMQALIR